MLATRAPADTFQVRFQTSKGTFVVEAYRPWAPVGVDRFALLASEGYYDGTRFYRVIPGMVAQWGLHGNPEVSAAWRGRTMPDDPVKASNVRGTLAFANRGPNTRATQLFINLKDNLSFDEMGFAPIGRVVEGMDVVDGLYGDYGEIAPMGDGPNPTRIGAQGNEYLARAFPALDSIVATMMIARSPSDSARRR